MSFSVCFFLSVELNGQFNRGAAKSYFTRECGDFLNGTGGFMIDVIMSQNNSLELLSVFVLFL